MAEERLIDDDKDRKYKIRKNEDGEDELIIDDVPDGEEESDIPVFRIPVYEEDDEEAATLTPEQLAERERKKAEEQASRAEKVETLLVKTRENLEQGDFEAALYAVSQAEELVKNSGEVYCLKLKALTRNFTDFLSPEKSAQAADGVDEYASAEQKAQLKSISAGLKERISQFEKQTAELAEQNEKGKQERREVFARVKKRASNYLLAAAVPFVVMLILAIVFSTMLFSAENGTFIALTAVFSALAFVALIFTLVAANKFWSASATVKQNENDNATKSGREYLAKKNELELLKRINASFDNDLSR